MKLMVISSRKEERIEDSGDCWRRFLPEFLKSSKTRKLMVISSRKEDGFEAVE